MLSARAKFSSFFSRGFTLIELMVVIAVIAVLSSVALVGLNRAQASARDVQRQASANGIRAALECYMRENGSYPATSDLNWSTLNNATTGLGPACMTIAQINDPYKNTLSTGVGTFTVSGSVNYTGAGPVQYIYARLTPTTYTLDVYGETKLFPFTNPN